MPTLSTPYKSPPADRRSRPWADGPISFVAWTARPGRVVEIAAALGGESRCMSHPRLDRQALDPLRYLVSALETVAYLARRRPRAVLVTNPPILPALISLAYGRLAGARVLLDSHPGGFGAQGDRVSARLQALHRFAVARADATLVSSRDWVPIIEEWGGRAEIVHEAPASWPAVVHRAPRARPRVLFIAIFAPDEPVGEVVRAARLVPEIDIRITGDPRRCPSALRVGAPTNVEFTGYLRGDAYRQAIADADVVLSLTTEPTSVMRTAYEAVYAERPLVVSDWPALRTLFSSAVYVANTADGIAGGLRRAVARHAELRQAAPTARLKQHDRWQNQLQRLRALINADDRMPTAVDPGGRGDP